MMGNNRGKFSILHDEFQILFLIPQRNLQIKTRKLHCKKVRATTTQLGHIQQNFRQIERDDTDRDRERGIERGRRGKGRQGGGRDRRCALLG